MFGTGDDMRGSRHVVRVVVGAVVAGTLGVVGVTPTDAAAFEHVTNVTNEDFVFTDDEAPGGVGDWLLSAYEQYGLNSVVRVEVDDADVAHPDGSLRIATPGEGDRVKLLHLHAWPDDETPLFRDFVAGGYSIKLEPGDAPAQYILDLSCTGPGGSYNSGGLTLAFVGPYPDENSGWRTVDVVQDGQALWVPLDGLDRAVRPLDRSTRAAPTRLSEAMAWRWPHLARRAWSTP